MPVECVGLHRCFHQGHARVPAVDGIDFAVRAGEFVAIVGPSGSGKSTFLHLLGGLDRPDRGQVFLEGREISLLSERELAAVRRRRLGFLLQFFSLLPSLDARENVAFPLLLDGASDSLPRAEEALARVGLADRASHRPAQLSGGEQQRVALARALVAHPAVVLADEPTGSLDAKSSRAILGALEQAAAEGQAIVIVTHDVGVEAFVDRIVHLVEGRVYEGLAVGAAGIDAGDAGIGVVDAGIEAGDAATSR